MFNVAAATAMVATTIAAVAVSLDGAIAELQNLRLKHADSRYDELTGFLRTAPVFRAADLCRSEALGCLRRLTRQSIEEFTVAFSGIVFVLCFGVVREILVIAQTMSCTWLPDCVLHPPLVIRNR
jgi:hypothetical protein